MHFSKLTVLLLIIALPLIWMYENMKKVIFFALVVLVIFYHTEIYDAINTPIPATAHIETVVGAPHANGPVVASPGSMGASAPIAAPIESDGITQWLKDHTPKK